MGVWCGISILQTVFLGGFPVFFPSPKAGKRAAGRQFGIIEMGGAP